MDKKKYTPLLPFDASYGENFTIYDPVPYTRDLTLIPDDKITKESGNVIKYYRCTEEQPVSVGGK